MVRFLWLNAFIGIYTIIMCVGALVLALFGRNGMKIHFRIAVPWARVCLRMCGILVSVKGHENVDPLVPRIYMSNHQSYFDIFALLAHLPVDFKFIVKQELMKIPLFGMSMRRAGYIGIERKDPRKAIQSMNSAAAKIRKGASVLIFPEGTRSLDGRLQSLKKGGFHLALKSGCAIVPVVISDSYRIVSKGSLKINKGSFVMHIGKPIETQGYSRKDITQLMERVREAMLDQLEGHKMQLSQACL
jgi:1-acyl-sn-glycerol-3-phosphate acyltransferase